METYGSRADLHCHSTASQESRLGVQRALGLPECATPPEEVYELAKRRGMDFVTITDHDTITGALEISDRPDVFISEELTASFKGEPQQVHVLCYGITPSDHEWLQRNAGDVEACAEYLHASQIACALAHPFYAVAAPLERPPSPPSRGAVPHLGDAQRLKGARAQHAGRDLHRDSRGNGDRAARTTTPESTSEGRSRRPRPRRARGSSSPTSAAGARAAPATRARPPSGPTLRWDWPSARLGRGMAPPRPIPGSCCR